VKITGGCFCRAIEYRANIDPARVGLCHCRDCQIFSGSAFRLSSSAPPGEYEFTKGQPKFFEKVADSGKVRRMAFCDNCGTHLCSMPPESEGEGGYVSMRLSTSDQFDQISPVAELFCASRVAWLDPLEDAAQFAGMPH
jgi:hypothetical protein